MDGGGAFPSHDSSVGPGELAGGANFRCALGGDGCDVEKKALKIIPQNSETLDRLAAIESSLEETEPAIQALRAASESGWVDYRSLDLDPRFDSIRKDKRFTQISEAMATRVASLRRQGQPLRQFQ